MENEHNCESEKFVILIVDDVKQNLKLLSHILEGEGYETSFALNGKETLEILKILKPDLILLDLMMPEMNGIEVCEIIKSDSQICDIPIIFLTASQEEDDLVKAFETGAVDYVTKPFKKGELLIRVKTQLKITQQAQQLSSMNNELLRKKEELEFMNQELAIYNDMVCHDIKNPLSGIKGYISILEYKYGNILDVEGIKYLKNIQLFCNRIQDILENMLILSQIKQREIYMEQLDISSIVTEIADELKYTYSDREFKIIIAPEITVKADAGLLRIALQNLLSNAWKFSSKNLEMQPEIEFGVVEKDNLKVMKEIDKGLKTTYYIRDNGIGFDMKNAEEIFDFFKRLHSKDEFEGTGIGLGIVKRIINFHGGSIWCLSKPNQGTTFYFTLN